MNIAKDFLNKLSVTEALTIVFVIGVGISLIFKLGFYHTLGIGWFINILSPQQLFFSSVSFVFFTFLGAIIGSASGLLSYKYYEAVIGILVCIMIVFFIATTLNIELLKREFYLFFLFMVVTICLTTTNKKVVNEQGRLLSELDWTERTFFEKVSPSLINFLLIIFLIFMVFSEGANKAQDILDKKVKRTLVKTKQDKAQWVLIEINGDKVLLMKDGKHQIFKVIEYKDIDWYSVS